MYLATRGLYNLKPPTVFVPPCIKDDVQKLLDIHRSMSQVELSLDLVALEIGTTFVLLKCLSKFFSAIALNIIYNFTQVKHMNCGMILWFGHLELTMSYPARYACID